MIAGVGLGVLMMAGWFLWMFWGRTVLLAIMMAAVPPALVLFSHPVAGVCMVAFVITSSIHSFLPGAFQISLVLTLLALVYQKIYRNDFTWQVPAFVRWSAVLYIWIACTMLWAPTPHHFWWFLLIPSVFLMLLIPELIRTPDQLRVLTVSLAAGIVFTAFSSVYGVIALFREGLAVQSAGSVENLQVARYYGHWGGANALAHSVMPFVALFVPYLDRSERRLVRWFLGLAIVCGIIAIALSLSRAAIIALAIALATSIAHSRYRWHVAVVVSIAVLAAVLFLPIGLLDRIGSLAGSSRDASFNQRADVMRFSWDMVGESFPLGLGMGGFYIRQQDYHLVQYEMPHPHNTILQVLIDYGFVGLVLFGMVLVSLLPAMRKTPEITQNPRAHQIRMALLGTFAGLLVAMLFESMVGWPSYWLVFCLISIFPMVFRQHDAAAD